MWTETKRQPNTFDASAVSQPAVVESNMAEEAPSLRTTLFNLLSTYQSYNDFSSFGGAGFGSIEGIHGTVHVLIGGSGHMSSVPVAGFDRKSDKINSTYTY